MRRQAGPVDAAQQPAVAAGAEVGDEQLGGGVEQGRGRRVGHDGGDQAGRHLGVADALLVGASR